ncbi:MAG: hypothetical protein HC769_30810 [Cyanobacteria bacterium CRU_2_1]|nr:hypothetical protein [Cyanobacteria bacterium CRU_2_1]
MDTAVVDLRTAAQSFRPDEATCVLRALVRHREMLLRYRASHIQHAVIDY